MAKNNGRRLFVFLMAVFLFHFRPTFLLFFIGPKIKMKTSDKKEESRKHRHRLTWRRKQLFYFWFCFYFLDSSFAGADFSTAAGIMALLKIKATNRKGKLLQRRSLSAAKERSATYFRPTLK